MARLVVRRLLAAIPLVLGVLTLTFVLMESAPGDSADLLLGDRPLPPEVRERLVKTYGLDLPPAERYFRWLGAVLRGELGWSLARGRPVTRLLADALPATLVLSGAALLIHLVVGMALGVAAVSFRHRWPDRLLMVGSLVLYAMPTFWLGLMAILGLGYLLPVFPPSSMHSVDARAWPLLGRLADLAWHLVLPACVLGIASAAAMARIIRGGLLQTLGEEFIRAARARGVDGTRVLLTHGMRSALLPVINLLGLSLPILVSGSLVTEVVFAWPGMGRLTYDAILSRDLPVVLAATLLASILVILGSLFADLAMAAADPRIRLGHAAERP